MANTSEKLILKMIFYSYLLMAGPVCSTYKTGVVDVGINSIY
ncbi:MAG: hypothetical protein PHY93_17975 [Bacteriovorax sp.]|nr:hypothetical protein [Bacteriovorax sp.]